jgi:uncharacterized RDD family membrane protein YckC
MYCEKCGNQIKGEAKFCTNCGTPLSQSEHKQQNTANTATPTATQANTQTQAPGPLVAIIAGIVWVVSILTLFIVLALLVFETESFGIEGILIGIVAAVGIWWSHGKVMAHSRAHRAKSEAGIKTYTNQMPATQSKRLLNLLLDYAGVVVFAVVFGFILGILGFVDLIENDGGTVLVYLLYLLYFMFFEGIWGKSPAKWFTKTRVVMFDGSKPPFANILGRSLARLIPFDPLSFISSNNPVGWHDKLSKTVVIDE